MKFMPNFVTVSVTHIVRLTLSSYGNLMFSVDCKGDTNSKIWVTASATVNE